MMQVMDHAAVIAPTLGLTFLTSQFVAEASCGFKGASAVVESAHSGVLCKSSRSGKMLFLEKFSDGLRMKEGNDQNLLAGWYPYSPLGDQHEYKVQLTGESIAKHIRQSTCDYNLMSSNCNQFAWKALKEWR